MDNLRNNTTVRQMLQLRGEGYMLRGINSLIEAEYRVLSVCNWGGLAKCIGKDLATSPDSIISGIGIGSCVVCAITVPVPDPLPGFDEAISCGLCATYAKLEGMTLYKALSTLGNVETLTLCLYENCGKNH